MKIFIDIGAHMGETLHEITKEKYAFEEHEYERLSREKLKRPYNVVAYDFGVKKNIRFFRIFII